MDAPAMDTPAMDTPTMDAPAMDTPAMDAPAMDVRPSDAPADARADAAVERPPITGPAVSIALGVYTTCAVLADGTGRCWGAGAYRIPGHGTTDNIGDNEYPASLPGLPVSGAAIKQIAVGRYHACLLLTDGTVRCWGQGTNGQLGYGNTNFVYSPPTTAVDVGGRVVQIAAAESHTCALLEGGTVRCWGRADFGTLGYGNKLTIGDDDKPSQYGDIDVGGKVVSIACGGSNTCAILDTGALRCWGIGLIGRLGYGNTTDVGDDETPASVGDVPVGGKVVQVASSFTHTCALLEGGRVRCWGYGSSGMLGYGNTQSIGDDETPASAGDVNIGGPAVAITVGHWHSCALLSGGAVRCWGLALQAELGYGNITNIGDDETPASAGDVDIGVAATAIAAGEEHTCILTAAGAIRCWGEASLGGLGYGNTESIGDNEVPASAGDVPF